MQQKPDLAISATELRLCAERMLAAKPDFAQSKLIDEKKLIHELQVHQIELEMQNEALQEACSTAEIALERYAELYDFAPVAYFTLGIDGIIQQTNFSGEKLLGLDRSKLCGRHFSHSVSSECRPSFNRFLTSVFASVCDVAQRCEMSLRDGDKLRWVAIEARADNVRQTSLAAVMDITEKNGRRKSSSNKPTWICSPGFPTDACLLTGLNGPSINPTGRIKN